MMIKYKINLFKTYFSKKLFTQINLQEISKKFWTNKKGDIDSMCGFKELNDEDIQHTKLIFNKINKKHYNYGLDVGAGIGRISFNFLYDICNKIDLLDINQNFLNLAKQHQNKIKGEKIKEFYDCELKNFRFDKNYDLIFIQWVLEYLSDEELLIFMNKVYANLLNDGITIIKENVSNIDNNLVYLQEGSLIRKPNHFEKVFTQVGFENIISTDFVNFKSVDNLCDIKYWILEKKNKIKKIN